MLFTITSTSPTATDLGYLLHKNPAKAQGFELPYGTAQVFYPEASDTRCTAALLVEVDPVGLVRKRGKRGGEGPTLEQYVNDRPYVASSFLSVAIAQVYRSALQGRCRDRPDLPERRLELTARLAVLRCRGGEDYLRHLFEPLGYEVVVERHPLDPSIPAWGDSPHFTVELRAESRLRDLLSHVYVLVPVLDNYKHYFVADEEVEKLLRHGEGWLATHPAREGIATRYLKHRKSLMQRALERLLDGVDPTESDGVEAREEEEVEKKISLNEQRLGSVLAVLRSSGARSVLDLGCGEGKLLRELLREPSWERIIGVDVSSRALEKAEKRLRLNSLSERQKSRIELLQGSLMYRDRRLEGFDAAAIVEVIEHLDPPRLRAFADVVFGHARPRLVVVTTPNIEFNVRFENLPAGHLRHRDHRFEWTRAEFREWAEGIASKFEYSVRFLSIGKDSPDVGAPTQMGVFER